MMVSTPVRRTLSPRELARALGASESSVKRWIDAGVLPADVTSGGHRRIELLSALRFVRGTRHSQAAPRVLGLSDPTSAALIDADALAERLFEHLALGRPAELERDLLALLTVAPWEPAELFDGPVRAALSRIGDLWQGDHRGIFVEHRATQILLHALDRLRALVEPAEEGSVAVGASLAGDPGLIATRMAATVLGQQGYRAVDLGADTPSGALAEAADELGARLVWLSVGHVTDVARQTVDVQRLADRLADRGIACILGGREIERLAPALDERVCIGRSMADLARLGGDIREVDRA